MKQSIILEKKLSDLIGRENTICTSSGTTALLAVFKALEFPPGSEIIIPGYSCVNVPLAVYVSGLKPRFADVSLEDYTILPDSVINLINKKTVAILPVHTFGQSYDVEEISRIAEENSLMIIEDFAQSFSGQYKGKPHGSFGPISITSFGRGKIIDEQGGAIFLDDSLLARKIRKILSSRKILFFDIEKVRHRIAKSYLDSVYRILKRDFSASIFLFLILRFLFTFNPKYFLSGMEESLATRILEKIKTIKNDNKVRVMNTNLFKKNISSDKVVHPNYNRFSGTYMYYSFMFKEDLREPFFREIKKRKYDYISKALVRKAYARSFAKTFREKNPIPHSLFISSHIVNLVISPDQVEEEVSQRVKYLNTCLQGL